MLDRPGWFKTYPPAGCHCVDSPASRTGNNLKRTSELDVAFWLEFCRRLSFMRGEYPSIVKAPFPPAAKHVTTCATDNLRRDIISAKTAKRDPVFPEHI